MIKVELRDNKPVVVIPKEYKEPFWLGYMYINNWSKDDDGNIIFPCRNTRVTIIKPVMQQTPMGVMQSQQTYYEDWLMVDIPQKSFIVNVGDDITDELGLELVENVEQITDKEKEDDKEVSNT